jgi:hypothetical protein
MPLSLTPTGAASSTDFKTNSVNVKKRWIVQNNDDVVDNEMVVAYHTNSKWI